MRFLVSDRFLFRLALGVIMLAFVAFPATIVWNYYFNKAQNASTERIDPVRPIVESDHVQGKRGAPVELIVFTDLECQYCKRFHQITRPALLEKYGDTIAIVYRNFPMASRPKARNEAEAAECVYAIAGHEAYWKFIDTIFAVTPSNNGLDLSVLPDIARGAGVGRTELKQCQDADTSGGRVAVDIVEGTIAGVTQTPSILVRSAGRSLLVSGDYPGRIETGIEYVTAVTTRSQ